MKYLFYLTIFVAGLIGVWSCNEETYVDPVQLTTIRGRVLYSVDQQPVRNAQIKLSPSSRIINTDSSGNFRFDSVIAGKYTIQVTLNNYGTQTATIETTTDNPAPPAVTILLSKDDVVNSPPTALTLVSPANLSTMQSTTLTLKWKSSDPNRDTLTYDLFLYRAGTPVSSFTGLTTDSLIVNLDYNTTYSWQVVAKDKVSSTNGPLWTFTTGAPPEYTYVFARRVGGNYQIFAANETGSSQLTRDGSNWRPIVSPNRRLIAFISNINTDLHIFVMNMDGSNLHQVTTVPINGVDPNDLSFCWSPDGTQLVYPSNDRLYSVFSDGTGLRLRFPAFPGRTLSGCDWTPQGNLITFRSTGTNVYDNEIGSINPDGTGGNFLFSSRGRRLGNPVFSINGRTIMFTLDSSAFNNEQGRQLDSRIHTLDVATKTVRILGSSSGTSQVSYIKPAGTNDLDPRYSPNGAQIIFTNTDNTGNGVRYVYVADVNGGNRRLLFTAAEMPYWR
jgi:Tol biopolymer transport system component